MPSFVPGHFDEYPSPSGEESSHPECPQDPGQTNLVISEMLQVAINTILTTLYFVITLLFRFATDPVPGPLDETLQALNGEPSHLEPQDPGQTQITEMQQVVITAIQATFHIDNSIRAPDLVTSNKLVHCVDQAVIEWNECILLPCEPSSKLRVSVYASFELGPMLCHGEVLGTFDSFIGELLNRSEKPHPIIFQPEQEEVMFSCTSLFMTVERRPDENDATVLCPLTTFMSDDMRALTDAGHGLLAQYRRTQNRKDLDQSIQHFEHALDICPMDHPCRPAALVNLATAKFVSCQTNGTNPDLDVPISIFQDTLDLRPTGHPDRPVTQLHLAIALLSRFTKQGFQKDVDVAEELLCEVLNVCHDDSHIYRTALLAMEISALHQAGSFDASDLGQEWPAALSQDQLADRAERCLQGDASCPLDKVISFHYDALGDYNTEHTFRGQLLGNLSVMLQTCFERQGNDEDLDQAITFQREALVLRPVGHTDRSMSLNNLVNQLSTRFDHRGNDEDLDQAIVLYREALALRPVGHTYCTGGNDEDLDQAIKFHMEALALRPVGHTDWPTSFNNIAIQLSTRFEHQGNDKDLDLAITLHREALALFPVGHTYRSSSLNNLAVQLSTRFDHRGDDEDLDQAIALHREALAVNLADQLFTHFAHQSNREDLDESRENLRCALTMFTQHDPRQVNAHLSLAAVHLLFHHSGFDDTGVGEDTDSLNAAMHHLKAAVNVVSAGFLLRLKASLRWVRYVRQYSHDTELELDAHATSMQLLDTYMSTTASVSSRHHIMQDFPSTLAVDAASCAVRSGDVCRAVELLEQGRTIIWTQMTRLRTPLDSLQTRDNHAAALVEKFRDLSSLLDKSPVNYPEATPRVDVEAEETWYRCLVKDWNRAVEEIRKIEGFSRFLLPPVFTDLQHAARDGPVIVLIASESSCDAIVIPHKQPPTSIQLPTNLEKLQALVVKLQRTSKPSLKKP
ncbi:hypothetical protein DFJ58DRAFT_737489 [Suillus subalutaceus]|uniref:uncharacterized protein n=1 Tax=Suillus subalutaceus TaxID=48586 RepID=UPI001B86BBF9|nr:uncharacterized protein DFJ58DRAFT_737489 [Suillus subalutaceus]KAG1829049.1 hypothetical protein DFJ58DRAFT_737489 [Suillus subalutaceus]